MTKMQNAMFVPFAMDKMTNLGQQGLAFLMRLAKLADENEDVPWTHSEVLGAMRLECARACARGTARLVLSGMQRARVATIR